MKLEHINLRVPSIANTQRFLKSAFDDFRERGSGFSETYGYWSHFGNDDYYLALLQPAPRGEEGNEQIPAYSYEQQYRLMHVGLEVEDVDLLMARLAAAGYAPNQIDNLDSHPYRRRVYYLDGNGVEWEFIQYLGADPARRNDYSL